MLARHCKTLFERMKKQTFTTNIKQTFISLTCTMKCSKLVSVRQNILVCVCPSKSLQDEVYILVFVQAKTYQMKNISKKLASIKKTYKK